MKRPHLEKAARETPQVALDTIMRLKEVVPEAFSEGKIDFEKLRSTLGNVIDETPERYSFSWAGKKDAIRILQTPSRATLVPDKAESVDFDKTNNLFIEGDNLEALKLLYKSYFGQVKMIYIDPPYNTGNDFVYPDDYADPLHAYLEMTKQKDADGNLLTSNPETSGRYHSSWLSMMYPRLFLARQLLRDDGVIFVSIDDNEVHNLRMIMNEVFGEENFIAELIWEKRKGGGNDSQFIASDHEYILCFIRNKTEIDSRWFVPYDKEYLARYSEKDEKGAYYWDTISRKGLKNPIIYEVTAPDGKKITLYAQLSERSFREKLATNEIRFSRKGTDWSVQRKIYMPEGTVLRSVVDDVATNADGKNELRALFDELDIFSNPKPTMLVRKLMLLSTQSGDLILDFFAGSGTTAHAIMAQNIDDSGSRRFILVQLPEPIPEESEARKAGYKTIADISKERLRRAGKKLKDGLKQQKLGDKQEVDLGFKIFKLAESNYRSWSGVDEKEPEAYAKQMTLFNDPLVKGWKPESVIWEVAIKEGYGLNSKIDSVKDVKANKVFIMTDSDNQRSFRICLDDELKPALLKELGLSKTDLFVCRDVALTDELAANLALQCRLKTI